MRKMLKLMHNPARLFFAAILIAATQAAVAAPLPRIQPPPINNLPMTPRVERAACFGWGPFCPPGWVRSCGFFACRCRPCF